MLLSVYERLVLLNILPERGDLTTLRIARDLRNDLSFSEEENARLKFKTEERLIKWNIEAAADKEITIGPVALGLIAERFGELDREKLLTNEHLPIYERFLAELASGKIVAR